MTNTCNQTLLYTAPVGSRGQVVIPKALREHFAIKSGDQVLFFAKDDVMMGVAKMDSMEGMITHLQGLIDQLKK